ncbi:MAG: hypothetical protein WCC95_00895 [Candidatus Sulfotelmatobacter sp.]|jgi:hypothetical protein
MPKLEGNLKVLRPFQKNTQNNRRGTAIAAAFAVLLSMTVSTFAQQGAMSPYQDEQDGVSAGGAWMQFRSEDKMTGAKKVRFELLSNNYFREDPDYKPRVEIVCTDGKYQYADFNPGERLGHPDYPGFWGQPKMEVRVRIDGSHDNKGWNWVRGRFLAMDKGTIRGAIGAQVFNIEVRTRTGYAIAEFSPAGLNLDEMKHSCDLTPHKP